jgi:molybdate-binding protein
VTVYHSEMVQTTQAPVIASRLAARVVEESLGPGHPVPSVRALAREMGCAPGTAARAHAALREAGVIAGPPRSPAVVADDGVTRALAFRGATGRVRLSGSDDPGLDLLVRAAGSIVERSVQGVGSVAGLTELARGTVDVAAVHLRDPRTGAANDPFVRRVLGGDSAHLVHLWRREQGIVVPGGNPLGIGAVDDLAGRTLAWRAPGTGSRLLLDRLLRTAGVRPAGGEEHGTHLGVAVAVASGAADAGLAVRASAEAVGAEFVPVGWEDFELAVAPEALELVMPVLEVLARTEVQDRLAGLGGYDLRRSGGVRVAA